MTMYALQHRSTHRWLALPPSVGIVRYTDDETKAEAYSGMSWAELERQQLGEFADAYEVVPLSRDTP